MRAQLSILDDQIAKQKGGQRQFGALSGVEQQSLVDVARRFKQGGRQSITQEELNMLRGNGLTADWAGKKIDADLTNNISLKQLNEITGQRDLGELEKAREKLKTEVDMKVQLDEEQVAKLMTEQLKKLNLKDLLGEIVKSQLELNLARPRMDAVRGAAERGGS